MSILGADLPYSLYAFALGSFGGIVIKALRSFGVHPSIALNGWRQGLDDLIKMKRAANRAKDREDLRVLRELKRWKTESRK